MIHFYLYPASGTKTVSLALCRIEFLLLPCVVLSLLLNHEFSLMEILWTFSIYLESVAILPQLFMVQKTGEAESIRSHYLFPLNILNWIEGEPGRCKMLKLE